MRLLVLLALCAGGCGFSVLDGLTDGDGLGRDGGSLDSGPALPDGGPRDSNGDGGRAGDGEAPTGDGEVGPCVGEACCHNSGLDGSETAVDCGGGLCAPCAAGDACLVPGDCATQVCSAELRCAAGTCGDGAKNGDESDRDCGGDESCDRCLVGQTCVQGSDCADGVCGDDLRCKAPTCSDEAANGSETAVDCGGSCAPAQQCSAGLACERNSDCEQPYCLELTCHTPFSTMAWPLPGQIQAEDYDRGGEGVGYHDTTPGNAGVGGLRSDDVDLLAIAMGIDAGYSTTGVARGEWLAYTVSVAADASDYNLELRVANRDEVPSSVHLELDGKAVGPSLDVPVTRGPQRFTTVEENRVTLPAGIHVLRVVHDSDDANLNWLRVSRAEVPFGGTAWPVPATTIQAEDFNVGGEGVAYHAMNAGSLSRDVYRATDVDLEPSADMGGGYDVKASTGSGDWLQYTINVTTAGTYALEVRVISADSGRKVSAAIDEVALPAVALAAGDDWQTVSIPGVVLPAGVHKVRIKFDNGFVGLNWLRFVAE